MNKKLSPNCTGSFKITKISDKLVQIQKNRKPVTYHNNIIKLIVSDEND